MVGYRRHRSWASATLPLSSLKDRLLSAEMAGVAGRQHRELRSTQVAVSSPQAWDQSGQGTPARNTRAFCRLTAAGRRTGGKPSAAWSAATMDIRRRVDSRHRRQRQRHFDAAAPPPTTPRHQCTGTDALKFGDRGQQCVHQSALRLPRKRRGRWQCRATLPMSSDKQIEPVALAEAALDALGYPHSG